LVLVLRLERPRMQRREERADRLGPARQRSRAARGERPEELVEPALEALDLVHSWISGDPRSARAARPALDEGGIEWRGRVAAGLERDREVALARERGELGETGTAQVARDRAQEPQRTRALERQTGREARRGACGCELALEVGHHALVRHAEDE